MQACFTHLRRRKHLMLGISRRLLCLSAACLAAAFLSGPLQAQGRDATPAGFTGKIFINEAEGVRIHTYMADPQGALVTTHIIEGKSGLIMVDAQFVAAAARELRRYVDGLGKPIERLYISHEHSDHWFGLHHFGHMPVHTGPLTARFLTERAAQVIAQRKADSSPPTIGGIVREGSDVVAGVTLNIRIIRDTEAPEMLVIEVPAAKAVIVQDFVYNKVHAVVSRKIDEWLEALSDLERRVSDQWLVLAGHGEPAGVAVFAEMRTYLKAVQALLQANLGRPDQAESMTQQIAAAFPQRRMPRLLTLGLSRALPN